MATNNAGVSAICAVCGQPADARASADCNWCNRRYHLNQRNDVEAKDCGQVWIDEQYMALQFACNDCLAEAGASDGTPAEGATISRMPASPRRERAPGRRHYRRRA